MSAPDTIGNKITLTSNTGVFDPAFGIRISNPKIKHETIEAFCSGMKKLKLGQLNAKSCEGIEWVTMAVIAEKSEFRKSAKDNEYMIWRIADLTNTQASPLKILLFGDCVKEHWKLQAGLVVMINNAQWADSKAEPTLKLTKLGQVLVLGFCPDFGTCKGRKADGAHCSHFVNTAVSEYCPYHIQQKARQIAASRGTLNQYSNLPPKTWRFNEPNAQSSLPEGLKTLKRTADNKTYVKPVNLVTQRNIVNDLKEKEKQDLTNLINKRPTCLGARYLLKNKENNDPRTDSTSPTSSHLATQKSMKQFITEQKQSKNRFIDLSVSPEKKVKSQTDLIEELKIKRAAAILRGGLKRRRDSGAEKSHSQELPSTSAQSQIASCSSQEPPSKKRSIFGNTFTTDQIQAMLQKKSSHEQEADQAEVEQQNKYFENREAEEKVESYTTSLMELKNCKVVTCKTCDYTSVQQSSYCKFKDHSVTLHKATKRFFKCVECKERTIAFELMPRRPCHKCKATKFERVAMRDERKVAVLPTLQIRGEERPFVEK